MTLIITDLIPKDITIQQDMPDCDSSSLTS